LDENHSRERAVRGPAVAEFEGQNGGQGTGFAVSSLYEGCRSLGMGGKKRAELISWGEILELMKNE